ncbi:MAG: thioredoxin [Tractidigestivibacter sp.]|jgi:thioredoxin 1|uniref:thioredoxin n=1 Tax=Tractidigestivibacter sp. TaxID=2847320 RepID=UPI003D9179AF
MEYTFTAKNFKDEVVDSDKPVLVDFYADWCGPCKMMMPVVEQLAEEYDGRVKVGKVNSDEEQELAAAFKVMSIPSFFIIKDGKVVDQLVGAMPKDQLKARIDAQL